MRVFKPRFCKKCGADFLPTSAKHYWCPVCAPAETLKNIRDRAKVNMRKRRAVDPAKERTAVRKCTLAQKGWTLELYERVYSEQGESCGICFCPVVNSNKESASLAETRLRVGCADHIHSDPPVPRGILCARCNALIAMAQDNQVVLASAIQYLRRYHG